MRRFPTKESILQTRSLCRAAFAVASLLLTCQVTVAGSWPQFRGPDGQGTSPAKGLPLTWSNTENVAWKVPVPGSGWSSPVIEGDQLWLTYGEGEGRSLHALCLSTSTGKPICDVEVFALPDGFKVHRVNSHASPTPILHDGHVYVHFGPNGTACLTTAGKTVWSINLPHVTGYGPSSSPVLYKDLLIVTCHGTDVRYLAALDKKTGEQRWKVDHEGRCSESTPLVISTGEGDQLVCNFAERVVSIDPSTGNILWTVEQGDNWAQIPRPVFGHGMVYVSGGYFGPIVQAIRPEGRGDITASHVAWSLKDTSVPLNPSPVLAGDELCIVNDAGIASCLDARTGKLHWRERLDGGFYASPLAADGRIYFFDTAGKTTVIRSGPKFEVLATNNLDEKIMASPAVVDRAIILRTEGHLFRLQVEEKSAGRK
jgi:outer membrane protein assembly factor BamB